MLTTMKRETISNELWFGIGHNERLTDLYLLNNDHKIVCSSRKRRKTNAVSCAQPVRIYNLFSSNKLHRYSGRWRQFVSTILLCADKKTKSNRNSCSCNGFHRSIRVPGLNCRLCWIGHCKLRRNFSAAACELSVTFMRNACTVK